MFQEISPGLCSLGALQLDPNLGAQSTLAPYKEGDSSKFFSMPIGMGVEPDGGRGQDFPLKPKGDGALECMEAKELCDPRGSPCGKRIRKASRPKRQNQAYSSLAPKNLTTRSYPDCLRSVMVKNNAGVSPKGAELSGGLGKTGYLRSTKGCGEIPHFIPPSPLWGNSRSRSDFPGVCGPHSDPRGSLRGPGRV